MDISHLETLVFSGGGIRGLSYVGALMAFQDSYGVSASKHFQTFVGTSVGSIFALVCAIGADLEQSLRVFETIGLESVFHKDPTWLLSNYSLNDGSALKSLVTHLLQLRDLDPSITLGDLYKKTQKHLVIVVVDLLSASTLYLDHTNEGSTMLVIDAIMGSMSLPLMFPPVSPNASTSNGPMLLSDGGLLDNFAIARFDPQKTLGIRTNWYMEPVVMPIDISSYYTRVLAILQMTMHIMQSYFTKSCPFVVHIDLGAVKADSISVNARDIIFRGYRAAISRFANLHSKEATVDNITKYITERPIQVPAYIEKLFQTRSKE
jgi:predicted acylesterase/phospholipase RssA